MRAMTASLLAGCLAASTHALADGKRAELTVAQFIADAPSPKLIANAEFLPPAGAADALTPFSGTVVLSEGEMTTEPAKFKSDNVLGKNPHIFPAVSLSFVTHQGDLVPVSQDVIRNGTLATGHSFWDIIVQPGRVWSEPGDEGWSRASFPFSLVNSIEGETHNGVAMYLYKDGQTTGLRYQIVQQTSPFYVEDYFTAAGSVKASFDASGVESGDEVKSRYEAALADAEQIGTWKELEEKVGAEKLQGFDGVIRPNEIVLDGLVLDDRLYLKSCPTPVGELPYCDRQRFGVWSATKSAATTAGMLRLAEKYGPQVFDLKIADYIAAAKGVPGWDAVTFGDALNMATGMGYGSQVAEPNSIFEPFEAPYYAWYEARTEKEKIDALLNGAKPYPWGPGKVARYRDEDMFLLGAAMTSFLKTKEGADANIWSFVQQEVYEPIGIHYAPTNKTIEADPATDQPLMAYGYYPTVGDLAKIARLYQNGGKFKGKQILNAEKLADIMPAADAVGLPTGDTESPYYRKGFWRAKLASKSGCSFYYPLMEGWGKNLVSLMPGGVTTIRLAKNWDGDPTAANLESLASVADRLKDLCR